MACANQETGSSSSDALRPLSASSFRGSTVQSRASEVEGSCRADLSWPVEALRQSVGQRDRRRGRPSIHSSFFQFVIEPLLGLSSSYTLHSHSPRLPTLPSLHDVSGPRPPLSRAAAACLPSSRLMLDLNYVGSRFLPTVCSHPLHRLGQSGDGNCRYPPEAENLASHNDVCM